MHFQDMTYQRITYEEIAADYDALCRELEAVSCEADCRTVLKSRYRLCEKMTPIDLCYVRHGMNVNDPFYAEEQRYHDEIGPKIGELSNRFDRLLVASPYSACFERLMGSFAFSLIRSGLEGYDSSLVSLEQEENALISEYNQLVSNARVDYNGRQVSRGSLALEQQSADRDIRRAVYDAVAASWDAQREELEDIFDRMVQNRDRQAKALGYESYVPLSCLRMNRIGYAPEDVARFREQVKRDLVPIASAMGKRRKARLGLDHLYPYDTINFLNGNPVPLGGEKFCLDMTREMFHRLSPETKEYIDFLLDNGLCDVSPRDGKQSGGYCTQFEAYRAPFIFANFDGTSENAYIMSHEGGHGFYFYLKRNEEIRERGWYTPEMAETHAMAMEFFVAPYMELFFGDRAEDYRKMHLEGAVTRILYQCQQDEFQQIIYENPRLTKAERNDVWKRLEDAYFPFREYPDEKDRARVGTRWQRIPHTFLWPFYAIDYALAQVCALQYCRWMDGDPDGAWQSYLTFCRASGSRNFPEAIEAAGLESPFAGCGKKEEAASPDTAENPAAEGEATVAENATYTYRGTYSGVSTWSPTDWKISSEYDMLGYAVTVFYGFWMNETRDGYDIVCELASEFPVDVTANYAGNETYGVPADATEGYYNSDKAGGVKLSCIADLGRAYSEFAAGEDGQYVDADGNKAYIGWDKGLAWLGDYTLYDYSGYLTAEDYEVLSIQVNEDGYIPATDETLTALFNMTSTWDETEEDLVNYMFCEDGVMEPVSWEQVGYVQDDDYTFTVILKNPSFLFDFEMNIDNLLLVNEALYEANKTETGGIIKSAYGTGVDKFSSYGPYKIVSYQESKEIVFTRNEGWFGYADERYDGMYQTTDINLQQIDEHTTQLSMFLQGNLDAVGLAQDDMEKYGTSDYVYYTPTSNTYYLALNTDFDMLKSREVDGVNKTILTYIDFRKAMTKIQMIFQDPISSLDPRMTVRETIAEGLIIQSIRDQHYIDEKVYEMLERVGLVKEHASRYPHEFSGGQRQRIGIARAIIMNPELIIADEPVSALDVSIQAQVINLLNELRDEMGLSILFIAHDLSVIKYFSDRIIVMYFGKIVEIADSDELFAHPLHPYTCSLLSAIPLPDPHYEKQRKRMIYVPSEAHDYSQEQPTLREVAPGHFVSCNTAEFERYCGKLAQS